MRRCSVRIGEEVQEDTVVYVSREVEWGRAELVALRGEPCPAERVDIYSEPRSKVGKGDAKRQVRGGGGGGDSPRVP